jgi:DnaJ-class molecular chaperone
MEDPYQILGVSSKESWEGIRQAYRRELLKHHPDKHLTEPQEIQQYHDERCKKIIIAFEVLQRKQADSTATSDTSKPWEEIQYWKNIWAQVEKSWSKQTVKQILKDTVKDVMQNWMGTQYHKLKIKVKLEEIHQQVQKRVRIRFAQCEQDTFEPIFLSCESVCQSEGIQKLDYVAPDGKDIYVEWHVQSHPHFYQDGYDLIYEQPITLLDYIQGRTFTLQTLDQRLQEVQVIPFQNLDIPIELPNQGLCHKGCLRIYLKLELPKSQGSLSEKEWLEFQRILKIWHHNQL